MALFHPTIMPQGFRAWQKDTWLDFRNQYHAVVGYRGCGKDYILQWWCALAALAGHQVVILNKDLRLNKEFMEGVRSRIGEMRRIGMPVILDIDNVMQITTPNGGKVEALASNPENLRGYHCHVIINEFGANPNEQEDLFTQAMAVAGKDYHFFIASNADRAGSFLERLFNDGSPVWERRRRLFNPVKVVVEGNDDELAAHMKEMLSDAKYRREFMCEFHTDTTGIVTTEMLNKMKPKPGTFDNLVMGIDMGFTNDPTGIIILGRYAGEWHVAHEERWWNTPVEVQKIKIEAMRAEWGVSKVYCDIGSLGIYLEQHLKRHKWFHGVRMSERFYGNAYRILEGYIAQRMLHIDRIAAPMLVDEFRDAKWDEETQKLIKPHVTVDGLTAQGKTRKHHCDLVDALFIACHGIAGYARMADAHFEVTLRVDRVLF